MGSLEWLSRRSEYGEFSNKQEKFSRFSPINEIIKITRVEASTLLKSSTPLPPIADSTSLENKEEDTTYETSAINTSSLLGVLRGHTEPVTHCDILPSFIITSSLDGNLRMWNRSSLEFVVELPCESPVYTFLTRPLNRKSSKFLLFAATESGKLVAWKVKCSRRRGLFVRRTNQYPLHQPNAIRALAVSADGQSLATGDCFKMHDILPTRRKVPSVRGTLKTWDFSKIVDCSKHPNSVSLQIVHNNMRTMKQLVESRSAVHNMEDIAAFGIRALAFTPDDSKLAVGFGNPENSSDQSTSKMFVICCARTLATLWLQDTVNFNINSVEFRPSQNQSISDDHFELLVSSERKLQKLKIRENDNQVEVHCDWEMTFAADSSSSSFSADGLWIVSCVGNTSVIRDAANGCEKTPITGHKQRVVHTQLASNGQILATASKDQTAMVWTSPITATTSKKANKPNCNIAAMNLNEETEPHTSQVNVTDESK